MSDFVPVRKVDPKATSESFSPVAKIQGEEKIPITIGEKIFREAARPTLEMGGMIAGGMIGGAAGLPAGPGAALTGLAGGALGYGMGRQAANILEEGLGYRKSPELVPRIKEAGRDIVEGAELEMGGRFIGKGSEIAGVGVKQLWGGLTGTGAAAIEKALAGKPGFREALRGRITGEEIVQEARDALNLLKSKRSGAYQADLAELAKIQQPIDPQPIKDKMLDTLKRYVRIDKNGDPDWARSALGPEKSEGVKRIKEIVDMVKEWGSKEGDNTVLGLDMLKRQLDDFYSDSSNARAFVTNIRNSTKDVIVSNAPNYKEMTAKYSEATKLIKDIEQGLMLRKHGMTGRMTADMTLRRLTSSMKDNFEMRRELVEILGNKTATDLGDKIAGHAMSSWIPRGLAGTGPSMLGSAALAYFVSPKFWPVLAASSPRISAEFLNIFGKGLRETPGMGETVSRYLAYEAGADKSKPIANNK